MGLLGRMFIPRGVRRAMRPARTVRRAVTPRPIKQLRRAVHPLDNIAYGITRKLNTKARRRSGSPVYRHGACSVRHRSLGAMARCRNL